MRLSNARKLAAELVNTLSPADSVVISARVRPEVAAKLKKFADAKEWTASKYLEKLIRQHIEEEDAKAKKGRKA